MTSLTPNTATPVPKPGNALLQASAAVAHAPCEGAGRDSPRKSSFPGGVSFLYEAPRASCGRSSARGVSSGFPRGVVGRAKGPAEVL